LRGLAIAVPRMVTRRTQLGGLDRVPGYDAAQLLFASQPFGEFRVSILWWLALAALGTWILLRTRWGNWIFGVGGNPDAARRAGGGGSGALAAPPRAGRGAAPAARGAAAPRRGRRRGAAGAARRARVAGGWRRRGVVGACRGRPAGASGGRRAFVGAVALSEA